MVTQKEARHHKRLFFVMHEIFPITQIGFYRRIHRKATYPLVSNNLVIKGGKRRWGIIEA
jgi:hypothetical protein